MTDDELEDMFRGSFANHATEAIPVRDPVVTAHAGARHRRRVLAGIAGAAAAVILAPAAVVAVTLGQNASNVATPPVPAGWRVESYNGIELKVPATWGWGSSEECAPYPTSPWVGRPPEGIIECALTRPPRVAHVWFDSRDPVGTRPGETTVHVTGLTTFTITVADADAAERQQILTSIHPVTTDSNGCASTPRWGSRGDAVAQPAPVRSLSVCLYYVRPSRPHSYLYYSARVGQPASTRAVELIEASALPKGAASDLCLMRPDQGLISVELIAHLASASYAYFIDPNACDGYELYNGGVSPHPNGIGTHPLTKASVRLWAIQGVSAYAGGPALTPYLPGQ